MQTRNTIQNTTSTAAVGLAASLGGPLYTSFPLAIIDSASLRRAATGLVFACLDGGCFYARFLAPFPIARQVTYGVYLVVIDIWSHRGVKLQRRADVRMSQPPAYNLDGHAWEQHYIYDHAENEFLATVEGSGKVGKEWAVKGSDIAAKYKGRHRVKSLL